MGAGSSVDSSRLMILWSGSYDDVISLFDLVRAISVQVRP
jgi:hypothetical protein